MEGYKRIFFIGLIVIALGVIFSTTLSERPGSLEIVFIAIGGLLFIASMSRKKKEEYKMKKETRKKNRVGEDPQIMKSMKCLPLIILCVIAISGYSYPQENEDVLFQASTIDALLEGVYDGEMTYGELAQYGDFGIGTFNSLDGEMIGLEGKFYQIKTDGMAYPVDDSMRTPFAVVTFFEADKVVLSDKALDQRQLEQYLDDLLPTKNIFYALKIEGIFKYIKARSVPRQDKPYPPLVEAVENQSIFEFHNTEGTLVGFRCPVYVEGINVPGYHLHFITEDRKAGGHLLECQVQNIKIEIDYTSEFYMALPENAEFYAVNLEEEKQQELEKVEK